MRFVQATIMHYLSSESYIISATISTHNDVNFGEHYNNDVWKPEFRNFISFP